MGEEKERKKQREKSEMKIFTALSFRSFCKVLAVVVTKENFVLVFVNQLAFSRFL